MPESTGGLSLAVQKLPNALLKLIPNPARIQRLSNSLPRSLKTNAFHINSSRYDFSALCKINERQMLWFLLVEERNRNVEDILIEVSWTELATGLIWPDTYREFR